MTDALSGLTTPTVVTPPVATTSAATSTTSKSALGKDDFLKLLVAQMTTQDPLNPTQGTEYVTQLAQFSLVEQSVAQSGKLDTLSAQMGGLSSNAASNLVGKVVNVRGHGIAWDGTNATGASVTLGGATARTTVEIQDASGKTVRTLQMGAEPKGAMAINWDGKDDSGQPAVNGTYTVKVTAADSAGNAVTASSDVSGTVTKVNYDKGYPELQLDSGATAPVSDLTSVGGIGK